MAGRVECSLDSMPARIVIRAGPYHVVIREPPQRLDQRMRIGPPLGKSRRMIGHDEPLPLARRLLQGARGGDVVQPRRPDDMNTVRLLAKIEQSLAHWFRHHEMNMRQFRDRVPDLVVKAAEARLAAVDVSDGNAFNRCK